VTFVIVRACSVVTEPFRVLSLFGVTRCYSDSKIKSVIINCSSAWRIADKSSVKFKTHKLFVALQGNTRQALPSASDGFTVSRAARLSIKLTKSYSR
jgi:hypothetical protein